MEHAYRDRERVFAGIMADRADWEAATRVQRHLAVAADAELRRRHPEQRFTPLRSAEPHPATDAHRAELALTAGRDIPMASQWIKDLAAGRRRFAARGGPIHLGRTPLARITGIVGQLPLVQPKIVYDGFCQHKKWRIRGAENTDPVR